MIYGNVIILEYDKLWFDIVHLYVKNGSLTI